MIQSVKIIIAVLLMLLAERVTITLLTRTAGGRAWVIRHRFLHPNMISVIRVPMGVISILLWRWGGGLTAGILWFSFWMITDLTDGTIARRCDLVTESGKWLDPLADKCMYFPLVAYFAFAGDLSTPLPLFWAGAVLLLDTIGQASRLFIKKKAANYFGKAKTALITVTLSIVALHQIAPLPLVNPPLVELLTISCALLAFLSFYCKAIPDEWYANTLTLANLVCGIAAIYSILHGRPVRGFILVFMGQFFDLFDGRMAVRFGSTVHGALFDDIADGTSFGLAIGLLIWTQLGKDTVGLALALIYCVAVAFRLYRFFRSTQSSGVSGLFEGYPSPAGAMMAGSSVLLFGSIAPLGSALVVASTLLMVSRIPYRHFGRTIWPPLPRIIKLLSFILVLLFMNVTIADSANHGTGFATFCFGMACLYATFGPDYPRKIFSRLPEADDVAGCGE